MGYFISGTQKEDIAASAEITPEMHDKFGDFICDTKV